MTVRGPVMTMEDVEPQTMSDLERRVVRVGMHRRRSGSMRERRWRKILRARFRNQVQAALDEGVRAGEFVRTVDGAYTSARRPVPSALAPVMDALRDAAAERGWAMAREVGEPLGWSGQSVARELAYLRELGAVESWKPQDHRTTFTLWRPA